ncbi:hypothetical protein ACFVVX_17685 [Kitasatospora sp. NPDC058170]
MLGLLILNILAALLGAFCQDRTEALRRRAATAATGTATIADPAGIPT